MELEFKDLSIGDFVMYNGMVATVDGLIYKGVFDEFGERKIPCVLVSTDDDTTFVECDVLKPIPITSGILEQNGWHREGCFWRKEVDADTFLEYYFEEIRFLKRYGDISEWSVASVADTAVKYPCCFVHQLQHALRLSEIEETLVL